MKNLDSRIRNFCIIAHIDHGKSTLADRLLEATGTIEPRNMKAQLLDSMDLERERGITIKLQPVRMLYRPSSRQDNKDENADSRLPTSYILNLIDTPGHVDFSYEVSRSLAACEGAILVVDATQGIQAQTLSNVYLAIEAGLSIIPVVNKIDLPAADPAKVAADIAKLVGCKAEAVINISAKTGENIKQLLGAIIERIPPPPASNQEPTQALVFDSKYDEYRGVILFVRLFAGQLVTNESILLMASQAKGQALEVGWFTPKLKPADQLQAGEIGYIVTNLKSTAQARVGDTVTSLDNPVSKPLAGYRMVSPFVYASFFPASSDQHQLLKEALAKLQLNDAALTFSPESSPILGFGFRVGFLGLLHLEIVRERLEREYQVELVITNPSTDYQVTTTDGQQLTIQAAYQLPEASKVADIKEPWVKGEIICPKTYLGRVLELINANRGLQGEVEYPDDLTTITKFEAPLANVITNFYDQLKSLTAGYGSFSYDLASYRSGNLVKLDILVGGEMVEPLSQIVDRSEAVAQGRAMVQKLKDVIPRQLFEVSIQAAIGGKIIAREDVKPLGKNVTSHLYGGDVTRKRKLWEKQKAGKKRMKKLGKVDIPPEAFMVLLKKE